jgi:hypothetical protein
MGGKMNHPFISERGLKEIGGTVVFGSVFAAATAAGADLLQAAFFALLALCGINVTKNFIRSRRPIKFQPEQARQWVGWIFDEANMVHSATIQMQKKTCDLRLSRDSLRQPPWPRIPNDGASMRSLAEFLAELGLGEQQEILDQLNQLQAGRQATFSR